MFRRWSRQLGEENGYVCVRARERAPGRHGDEARRTSPAATSSELQVSDGEAADFDNVLVVVSPPDIEPPPAVGDLTARAKPGRIDLVWSPVEGAVAYDVHRGLAPGGPYERIAAGHATGYAAYADLGLANDVTYYYVVRAIGPDAQESPDSNEASATPSARTRLRTRVGLRAPPRRGFHVAESTSWGSLSHEWCRMPLVARWVRLRRDPLGHVPCTDSRGITRIERGIG